MRTEDLDYFCPPELIALEPARPTRVAWFCGSNPPAELTLPQLLHKMAPGDLLVRNQTQVIPARVFAEDQTEVLFLKAVNNLTWQVLFPAQKKKVGDSLSLPGGLTLTLTEKNLPQIVATSRSIDFDYFNQHGELALPPYIQAARGDRHNRTLDSSWYQSIWASVPGSVAAPTASLHFSTEDIQTLKSREVQIADLTLHVGAGTFLPIRTAELTAHQMHSEWAHIPSVTLAAITDTRDRGGRIWALGTTVARTLESFAQNLLQITDVGAIGETKLFIYPPYEFQNVDVLLTNFHQPKSTLLALVAAFSSLERTKANYQWAIEQKFRLFSYGDLSAWSK